MTTTGRVKSSLVTFEFVVAGIMVLAARIAPLACAAEDGTGIAAQPDSVLEKSLAVPDPYDPVRAAHLSGRVIGPDGKPVRGARIYFALERGFAWEADDGGRLDGKVRSVTDDDGYFEFDAPDMTVTDLDGLPTRRQGVLVATADGYAPDWRAIWGRPRRNGMRRHPFKGDLVLQLGKEDVPIRRASAYQSRWQVRTSVRNSVFSPQRIIFPRRLSLIG